MKWRSGEITCKLYIFLHFGTMSTHAFMLVFLLLFLYFWYRKQEAYMNADGSTVVRQTRMHKWAIPLAWIIGFGLAAVAGALARETHNQNTGIQTCAVWDGRGSGSGGYSMAVANVFVSFIGPTLIMAFPFIALLMQVCGGRQPKLDPPHNRNAMIALALAFVFIVSRAPYEIYELMRLFHQSSYGFKANPTWGTPYAHWTFETDIILNCMIFVTVALHPIIYFVFSPEYRTGLSNVWKGLACNQTPAERARQLEAKRQGRQFPANNGQGQPIVKTRTPMHMRPGDQPLLASTQPQIVAAAPGQPHYYPYPQIAGHQPQVPQPGTTYLFPEHSLQQTSFNNRYFVQILFEITMLINLISVLKERHRNCPQNSNTMASDTLIWPAWNPKSVTHRKKRRPKPPKRPTFHTHPSSILATPYQIPIQFGLNPDK